MLFVDRRSIKDNPNEVTTKQGMFVGSAQVLALIPGVSRSGATMTAGIFFGLDRKQAAKFSFLLAVPIIAGSALGILFKDGDSLIVGNELLVGMVAAFASGLFAIKFMLGIIAKVGLRPFAYYRIALALIVFVTVL
jgi:undecaprenyl-diphosphatase